MSDRPKKVFIREEGPREGFQIEPQIFPLEDRVRLVEALAETGLTHIQVASFVSPKRVPQMADSEAFFAALRKKPGVHYTGLWLNEAGFHRARACPNVDLSGRISLYASDAFARQNNGCGAEEMLEKQSAWMDLYDQFGIEVEAAMVMAAFGCNREGPIAPGKVVRMAKGAVELCASRGKVLPKFYLADTMGWGSPDQVRRLVGAVREVLPDETLLGLHLHDTRGLGLANVLAALEMGVSLFDGSVAGLGGCPFAGHGDSRAAGNVCTEDLVFLCEELGIETGVDLDALIECARLAERIIGRPLNGRLMKAGSLNAYRAITQEAAQ